MLNHQPAELKARLSRLKKFMRTWKVTIPLVFCKDAVSWACVAAQALSSAIDLAKAVPWHYKHPCAASAEGRAFRAEAVHACCEVITHWHWTLHGACISINSMAWYAKALHVCLPKVGFVSRFLLPHDTIVTRGGCIHLAICSLLQRFSVHSA